VAVGKYSLFPYSILDSILDASVDALNALITQKELKSDENWLRPSYSQRGGLTVWDKERAFEGMTFMTLYRDEQYGASLIDITGRRVHSWHVAFSEVWPEADHVISQAPDEAIQIHGAHLYPNGDIVFNFESGNFPFGGGMVKIDYDSNLIWSLSENTHHSIYVDSDGNIWACAHKFHKLESEKFPHIKPPFIEDYILSISPDGRVKKRISMLEVIYQSRREGILFANAHHTAFVDQPDPLHLNDVEILNEKMAENFELFEPGDIMVSFRNIDTIAVIDPKSMLIKWSMTGPFLRQHDPDFLPNGNILVFDNRMDNNEGKDFGGSRILEIAPVSQKVIWSYEGTDDRPFFTDIYGKQELLPNGNVLVVESERGRVFEVTHDTEKRIVWEYVNKVKDGYVGNITQADRILEKWIDFLNY
jgi:hypothetical protein